MMLFSFNQRYDQIFLNKLIHFDSYSVKNLELYRYLRDKIALFRYKHFSVYFFQGTFFWCACSVVSDFLQPHGL